MFVLFPKIDDKVDQLKRVPLISCKKLAQCLGDQIEVTTEYGKDSVFIIELSYKQDEIYKV